VAEILFGDINPSGKLPATFERDWSDNPSFENYHDEDGDKRVFYKEGLFMGYRYYDKSGVKPLFPFGFGLSYTTFQYENMRVEKGAEGMVNVKLDVTNTGERAGNEIIQAYVHDVESSLPRPVKELKAFAKVFLKPGETGEVTMELNRDAFMYYNPAKKQWVLEPGRFDILVGASSQDIRLEDGINLR
jgi:beta-glucosidase